jgi:hypothetical protein
MTSITMKAGTALRAEAVTSCLALSSIISNPHQPAPLPPHLCGLSAASPRRNQT